MAKKVLLALIILSVASAGVFAQDGFIKATFGAGYSTMSLKYEVSGGGASGSGDIGKGSGLYLSTGADFVHSTGITIGFKFNMQPDFKFTPKGLDEEKFDNQFFGMGIGYTLDGGQWCAGGKLLLAMPISVDDMNTGLDFGFGIDGTYWILGNLGITGFFDFYYLSKKYEDYQGYSGVTMKYSGPCMIFGIGVSLKF